MATLAFCANDPVNGIDPLGLETWSSNWETDPTAKKIKEFWLGTEAGKAKLAEIRKLEGGKDIVHIVWDPSAAMSELNPMQTPSGELTLTLNGKIYKYETDLTDKNPSGKVDSMPVQSLHHEMSHAAKRLEYGIRDGSYVKYVTEMQTPFSDPKMKKWKNPSEKNAVAQENVFLSELRNRAKSDADPRPPARTRYIPRQWDVAVTSEGLFKDGKLVKVEKEERFYKGISVRTLPPSLKKEYEELLLQEEQVHKQ